MTSGKPVWKIPVLELLELETDEALIQEAQTNITQLHHELDQWELQQLLSGPYDEKGAVLTINAGAGNGRPRLGRDANANVQPLGRNSRLQGKFS